MITHPDMDFRPRMKSGETGAQKEGKRAYCLLDKVFANRSEGAENVTFRRQREPQANPSACGPRAQMCCFGRVCYPFWNASQSARKAARPESVRGWRMSWVRVA